MVDRLVNSEANARRIALVESCFGTAGQPLSVPGRVLVGEGVLTKMCRKKPKPRQFYLFNDILVYGNIIISKKKYNKQHIIPLEDVKLSSLEDEGQFRNGWLICSRGKSFAVYAATATEKQEWMAHINKCFKDLIEKSGKKPANEHAAVWVPDSEASRCMVCKQSQFSMINRRHHCRKCGSVVCGSCSTRRFLLPFQSVSKPKRVCDPCHEQLLQSQSSIQTSSRSTANHQGRKPAAAAAASSSSSSCLASQQASNGLEADQDATIAHVDLFPDSLSPDVPLPDAPPDEPLRMTARNPRLYQLVQMDSFFWWDTMDAPDDDVESAISVPSCISQTVHEDCRATDSSGEDDTDDEEGNGSSSITESNMSMPETNFYAAQPVVVVEATVSAPAPGEAPHHDREQPVGQPVEQ